LRPRSRRLPLLALAGLLGLCVLAATISPPASGQSGVEAQQRAADRLRAAIAAESARIAATQDGLADAEQRLAVLDARVDARESELAQAQDRLIRSRIHLTTLQRREAAAKQVLADNLVSSYKAGRPQLVNIVFSSTSFSDLYKRLEFLKRLSENNARILDDTRVARADVARVERRAEVLA